MEQELRILSRAIEQCPVTVVITDLAGSIEYVNPKFTELTGYTLEEVRGRNPRILKSGDTTEEEYRQFCGRPSEPANGAATSITGRRTASCSGRRPGSAPSAIRRRNPTHYLAVKEDITDRRRIEERAGAGQGIGRGGQPRQERVSGQHEP